ncbi:TonB-dependent receptor plug domain-containing protein [Hymenobacter sp. BT186]|uniref:TonB-dependent receptor plug domain-containing protein n=1 Tax=Hymenobacter telluris TaxID=2816474 RepID=A0A939JF18_9BACT|nr:TonB-dependent receptor [Hymenobacter telluris]MBO0359967.1 TonB-dependent receptor plug domain-containing protein [Hymenobacter telluris]MBW3375994.1 TonB-dependent receptor plug domain-containing protein [Hymenobacter norwichensis]
MPYRYAAPLLLLPASLFAQTAPPDTTRTVRLPEATVTGYGQQLPLRRTAAAVGVVDAATFERFPQNALTQAINTLPGVRLEERATASYRLSVRGSTLRSPFGVRNVKVYYEGIPFTEASGSTNLNLLDPSQLGRLEVLKGPAASVYGAGTGGAVLLENRRPVAGQTRVQTGFTAGSYGLRRYTVAAEAGTATGYFRAQYARQTLDGYREQSALRRTVLTLDGEFRTSEKGTLALHGLYSDLDYQIPGSLTRAQFDANPRQARPSTPTAAGTVAQQAGYASRTVLLGATYEHRFTNRLSSRTTLYGTGSTIVTPFLVDLERNTPLGSGGRTVVNYRTSLAGRTLRLQGGAELQTSFESSRNYQNRGGTPGPLRYDDEIRTLTGFGFAQADYELPAGLLLTAGASYNRLRYRINRLTEAVTPPLQGYQTERNFQPRLAPRLALLKELTPQVSVYGSVGSGFSPPTEEEIRPSNGSINTALQAERGTSYEVGTRGTLFNQRLKFDVAAYNFRLRETIVTRTDELGTQLFANSGNTRQRGLEAALSGWLWQQTELVREYTYPIGPSASGIFREEKVVGGVRAFASYAYNHYRFGRYESGGNNFSGNRLTGTAPHTLSAGLDFSELHGFYLSPTTNHQARIFLNDANTVSAPGYWTFATRAGWRRTLGQLELDIFGGVENATNRRYSLGNDLNAFGSRYFQPAPGRNYYGGAQVAVKW